LTKNITFRKKHKEKIKKPIKIFKYLFTGSNIKKYSGLNTSGKYMNKQGTIKSVSTLFPNVCHCAKKFWVNQIMISIVMEYFCGITQPYLQKYLL